jgi:hypothetical protein
MRCDKIQAKGRHHFTPLYYPINKIQAMQRHHFTPLYYPINKLCVHKFYVTHVYLVYNSVCKHSVCVCTCT